MAVTEKSFTEKYINIIGLVILLIGIVLWIWGYNLESTSHSKIGKAMETMGEFLSLVVSLHFLYEIFTKKAERKILQEELNNIVNPQRDILDSLKRNISDLDEHTKTVFNLVRYKDNEFFEAKWKSIVSRYNRLYIIGDFNIRFLDLVKDKLQTDGKSLLVYICADEKNFNQAVRILEFSKEVISEVSVYHIDRLDWGFIAFGIDEEEKNSDLLLNYFSSSERIMSGYHIIGDTAINLLKSLSPNIEGLNKLSVETRSWPLKITDIDILKSLLEKRRSYNHEISNLRKGYQLQGEKEICEKMSDLLSKSLKSLKVTHIAKGENITLMEHADFQSWLQQNFMAASRGVDIERIFLLPRREISNSIIRKVAKQLQENRIKIKYVFLEETTKEFMEDFSIYDEKHLVYICASGTGPWLKDEDEAEARFSLDKDIIKKYQAIFDSLSIRAKEFHNL